MNSAERVKAKAAELGFSKAGIARVGEVGVEASRLREWLDSGFHATMHWMKSSIEKRTDVNKVLPGAKSVIALAMNYFTPEKHPDSGEFGKISRYAWGDDYHDILSEKLKMLDAWLGREFIGYEGRYYVDTGPIMEKAWAQKAGVGWIGKHTNVITQEMGSWVFLGEIITNLELEPDSPATDHCGTCSLCIEACPTGAITEPYVVDSGRCLSYLTIEHRGNFDKEFRTDGWIYGCDVCQDVCPWNERFATETEEKRFQPREGSVAARLTDWKSMSREEFSARFKRSPIKRTKHEGLIRNIRAVLDEKV